MLATVGATATCGYDSVALVLSHAAIATAYRRAKAWLDLPFGLPGEAEIDRGDVQQFVHGRLSAIRIAQANAFHDFPMLRERCSRIRRACHRQPKGIGKGCIYRG